MVRRMKPEEIKEPAQDKIKTLFFCLIGEF